MTTVVNPPVTATTPVIVDTTQRRNTMGLIALGLAIVGFVLAVFAVSAGLAWLLLVPAIILGVIGLILPDRRKGSALAAVIIAVVALFLSFVGLRLPADLASSAGALNNNGGFAAGSLFGGTAGTAGASGATGGTGANGANGGTGATGPGAQTPATPADPAAQPPLVGADVGVAGTSVNAAVQGVDCGLPLLGLNGLNVSTDVLCAVHVNVQNGTGGPVDVNSGTISLLSGGSPLTVDASAPDALNAHLAAGESIDGTVYVRVPAGTSVLNDLSLQVN